MKHECVLREEVEPAVVKGVENADTELRVASPTLRGSWGSHAASTNKHKYKWVSCNRLGRRAIGKVHVAMRR